MTEPGNSKSPEEISNQLRPHPSETSPNVAAQTLNITNSGEDGVSSSKFRQQRYLVSILVLASLMLATCLVQSMASSTNRTLQYVTLPCSLCFAFYVYQWVVYYSDGLTPRKMAHFDPRNLFKTYQPHKYIDPVPKSPPTPNVPTLPTKDAIQQENGQSSSAAEIGSMQAGGEFNAQRKEYYRNEYTNALEGAPKTAKEAEDDEEYQTGTKDDDQNE